MAAAAGHVETLRELKRAAGFEIRIATYSIYFVLVFSNFDGLWSVLRYEEMAFDVFLTIVTSVLSCIEAEICNSNAIRKRLPRSQKCNFTSTQYTLIFESVAAKEKDFFSDLRPQHHRQLTFRLSEHQQQQQKPRLEFFFCHRV